MNSDNTDLQDRLLAFAKTLQDPQRAMQTLMGDEKMVEAVEAILGNDFYTIWVMLLGVGGAMKVAFLLGAAWQREVTSLDDPKLNNLLNDVNLDD